MKIAVIYLQLSFLNIIKKGDRNGKKEKGRSYSS